jgi:alcohol dehydrogenase class IV
MNTLSFQHFSPPARVICGDDSLAQLGKELARAGCQRAVIVCGASLVREGTLLETVKSAMGERFAGQFSEVRAHSPVSAVEAAATALREYEADAVVAVGGGSAIVTARAASILLAEGKDIRALSTTRDAQGALHSPRLMATKIPQFVIPTTPTTAVAKAGSAVFDPQTEERLALYDPKTRAQTVFVAPAMVSSSPLPLLISASLNTYAMAIEGLISRQGDPMADALLMHALRMLSDAFAHPDSLDGVEARTRLVLAAIMCGQGTDFTGAGVTTVLGHAIGARCGVENGIANAILLPHVLRFNAPQAGPGLAMVGDALGLPGADVEALIHKIRASFQNLGVEASLSAVQVPSAVLEEIAESAMGDWFLKGNPRQVEDTGQLLAVLQAAF